MNGFGGRVRAGDLLKAENVPVAVALAMLVYRFVNLDLVTFINDEPHLLAAAEDEAHGGAWVLGSPISGTQGLHYGPVPTWFFGIVHAIFGARPLTSIVAMGLVVTVGQIVFASLLTRIVKGGPAVLAVILALMASSPFDFAWSRTAWDNTILVGAYACGALLLIEEELTAKRCLVAGTLFGLSIGTHLMVLPSLIVLGVLTLILRRKKLLSTLRAGVLVALPAAIINVPYALYLSRLPHAAADASSAAGGGGAKAAFDVSKAAAEIVTTTLQPARILSLDGIQYFFDDAWGDFRAWLGPWAFVLDDASFALVIAVLAFGGLAVTALRSPSVLLRRLGLVALAMWLGHALFLVADGLAPHPHYQHPVWWTIPTGLALLIVWLRSRAPQAARGLVGLLWIFALAQFAFLPMWMHYVRERGGTRGIHYTTPVADEERFLRAACSQSDDVQIENHTVIYAVPLEYIAATDPACKGKRVTICNGGCRGGGKIFQLRYQGQGARLAAP